MAKSSKIDIKLGKIIEENNDLHMIHFDEELQKEIKTNITQEICKFINVENINFKMGKGKKGGGGNPNPSFKYICSSCGRKIKSTEEDLEIKCLKCNEDFIKED